MDNLMMTQELPEFYILSLLKQADRDSFSLTGKVSRITKRKSGFLYLLLLRLRKNRMISAYYMKCAKGTWKSIIGLPVSAE